MWKIARLIVQNGSLVLFILLQCISLFWVVKYNQKQQKIYLHSYQLMAGSIQSKYQQMVSYFKLRQKYDSLAIENARILSEQINQTGIKSKHDSFQLSASTMETFKLIPATVINNSTDKRNNMITLDKGGMDGIAPGMGVMTAKGIVGIVTDTSAHYSLVMSVLHGSTNISALLKRCRFIGSLVWNGNDPSKMNLKAIQKYADVRLGDTIVTSGYSIVFPKNLLIGFVDLYKIEDGSFTYKIDVSLSQPMTNLEQVYVITNNSSGEKEELEKRMLRYE